MLLYFNMTNRVQAWFRLQKINKQKLNIIAQSKLRDPNAWNPPHGIQPHERNREAICLWCGKFVKDHEQLKDIRSTTHKWQVEASIYQSSCYPKTEMVIGMFTFERAAEAKGFGKIYSNHWVPVIHFGKVKCNGCGAYYDRPTKKAEFSQGCRTKGCYWMLFSDGSQTHDSPGE